MRRRFRYFKIFFIILICRNRGLLFGVSSAADLKSFVQAVLVVNTTILLCRAEHAAFDVIMKNTPDIAKVLLAICIIIFLLFSKRSFLS